MEAPELIPHLFRTEFSKITAIICSHFGLSHIEMAEDIAGDTFLSAMESWPYKGIPENPTAWLYAVAKNKAKNQLKRNALFDSKIAYELRKVRETEESEISFDISEQKIQDSQLQMLFAICHPALPEESQIGLALRFSCGFGIDEIATAFLSNKETIQKRLFRAKEKIRTGNISIAFPEASEIYKRIDTVLKTLYLLFSEGYYSESQDSVLREDLCLEAMRLTHLLVENEQTASPSAYALLALMCFHASRFEARKNENGEIILYPDQDETLWNRELIERGGYYLHRASMDRKFSKYHYEAGIAFWHTIKEDSAEKWEQILRLYNQLLQLEYSPVAALNRTYSYSKVHGKEKGIAEAEKLNLTTSPYYFTLLAELYTGLDNTRAEEHYASAIALTKNLTERVFWAKKMAALNIKPVGKFAG